MKNLTETLASAVSMAQSQTSAVLSIPTSFGYFIQASWSGSSPVGTLQVQASADNVTWTNYGSSQSVSGNMGSAILENSASLAPFIQVIYTFTSGTGSLTLKAYSKGV